MVEPRRPVVAMRRRRPPRGRPWSPRARLLGDTPAPLLPPSPSLVLSSTHRENVVRPRILSHARHRCRLLHRHVPPSASFLRAIAMSAMFVVMKAFDRVEGSLRRVSGALGQARNDRR
jgi:hypothetical protein